MQWIKENSIIASTLLISLIFHSIFMFYNKQENIIKENIITFEIVHQTANTNISEKIEKNENTQQEKQEEVKEEIKKEEVKEEKAVKKAAVPKKQPVKKDVEKKKENKTNKDIVKSAGENKINNQAETYIKQNYAKIEQDIVSRIVYPPRAKKLGIEGSGYLIITIDKTGTIISVKAYDFPSKLLQDAALKAAKKAGSAAGHGMMTNIKIKVPVTFSLN
ncbi:MAG: TonB family protein [Candidatus Mucispirillum faecigallinarum]|nr:TonB family protein [Candidatus Mucispirillum faecigallinarum]